MLDPPFTLNGETPMAISTTQAEPIEPKDPVDPMYCPTCFSGTPPRDPWFDDAIGAGGEAS